MSSPGHHRAIEEYVQYSKCSIQASLESLRTQHPSLRVGGARSDVRWGVPGRAEIVGRGPAAGAADIDKVDARSEVSGLVRRLASDLSKFGEAADIGEHSYSKNMLEFVNESKHLICSKRNSIYAAEAGRAKRTQILLPHRIERFVFNLCVCTICAASLN